jgi:hypothetical protein
MLSARVYRMLNEYAAGVVKKARRRLRFKGLGNSSALVKSIDYAVRQDMSIEFEFNEYGEYVDKGRRKGAKMPPIKPIEKWIKRKGLDLNAFAVAKSISKKGIKPFPWIVNVFPSDEYPNSKPSRELDRFYEELVVLQIEDDLDTIED